MTSDDLKKRLEDELAAAVGYADSQFADDRIEAVNFYLGKQFNTVPSGRSTVVATEVSDVVEFILPSLMEVFMRSGDIVRFTPRNRDDVGKAQAATILVNSIFTGQNNGFLVLHDFVTFFSSKIAQFLGQFDCMIKMNAYFFKFTAF